MKKYKFIPAAIVLIILLCAPMSYGALCSEEPGAGLICFCCRDAGKTCPMISCACSRDQIDQDVSRITPEMSVRMPDVNFFIQSVLYKIETIPLPEPVYLEVPVQPPIIS